MAALPRGALSPIHVQMGQKGHRCAGTVPFMLGMCRICSWWVITPREFFAPSLDFPVPISIKGFSQPCLCLTWRCYCCCFRSISKWYYISRSNARYMVPKTETPQNSWGRDGSRNAITSPSSAPTSTPEHPVTVPVREAWPLFHS